VDLSHKIRIYPTEEQERVLVCSCGVARFAYNWGLAEWKKQYEEGSKPNANLLKKQFNSIKREQFPWMYDCPKDANQQAFTDLGSAFQRFFKKQGKYPRFKKKGVRDSFYVSNDKFSFCGDYVKLPKIGKVRAAEQLRFTGKINSGTVSRIADKWFISISVDVGDYIKPRVSDAVVGVDLGVKSFVTTSGGVQTDASAFLKCDLKRLRRLSKGHSRKVRGSNNRRKSALRLARLHYKVKCKRSDYIHKLTTRLCSENQAIIVEDLNVRGMLKNRKLSRSIADAGFGEFRRQLEYKCKVYGSCLVKVGRFFPSSKQCSNCGCIKVDLKLSDRVYVCEHCGFVKDRDVNAALNLLGEGLRILVANEEFTLVDKEALAV